MDRRREDQRILSNDKKTRNGAGIGLYDRMGEDQAISEMLQKIPAEKNFAQDWSLVGQEFRLESVIVGVKGLL